MHVVIGVITAFAGLVWALNALQRAGFDLNALNPFLWYRRAQWKKKYGEKPLYTLEDPMEVAAVLILGTAKCKGEITAQQKAHILEIFTTVFKLGQGEAEGLLVASTHLLRDVEYVIDHLPKLLARSKSRFTQEQVASTLALLEQVAAFEGAPNAEQTRLIQAVRTQLAMLKKKESWS